MIPRPTAHGVANAIAVIIPPSAKDTRLSNESTLTGADGWGQARRPHFIPVERAFVCRSQLAFASGVIRTTIPSNEIVQNPCSYTPLTSWHDVSTLVLIAHRFWTPSVQTETKASSPRGDAGSGDSLSRPVASLAPAHWRRDPRHRPPTRCVLSRPRSVPASPGSDVTASHGRPRRSRREPALGSQPCHRGTSNA